MQKYKETLIFIWNSFSWHRKLFYVFFIWRIISGIFSVIIPILAKLEMDQLVEKNKQLFGIIELSGFSIFIIILLIIFITTFIEDILRALISFFEEDYIKIYDNQYSIALYKRLENTDPWIFLNARNKRFIGDILWNMRLGKKSYRRKYIKYILYHWYHYCTITYKYLDSCCSHIEYLCHLFDRKIRSKI